MKCALVVLFAFVALVASQSARPAPLENIDVDNTLKNEKLVRRYIDCVLDKGRCDTNGKDLKDMLPRVLKQNCAGCTPKQRENADRITDFMKRNHPADWSQISAKYSV